MLIYKNLLGITSTVCNNLTVTAYFFHGGCLTLTEMVLESFH